MGNNPIVHNSELVCVFRRATIWKITSLFITLSCSVCSQEESNNMENNIIHSTELFCVFRRRATTWKITLFIALSCSVYSGGEQ